jgi:hypothetical protein
MSSIVFSRIYTGFLLVGIIYLRIDCIFRMGSGRVEVKDPPPTSSKEEKSEWV